MPEGPDQIQTPQTQDLLPPPVRLSQPDLTPLGGLIPRDTATPFLPRVEVQQTPPQPGSTPPRPDAVVPPGSTLPRADTLLPPGSTAPRPGDALLPPGSTAPRPGLLVPPGSTPPRPDAVLPPGGVPPRPGTVLPPGLVPPRPDAVLPPGSVAPRPDAILPPGATPPRPEVPVVPGARVENGRAVEVNRRGANGANEQWTVNWDNTTNPPTIRNLSKNGQVVEGLQNPQVDPVTGQIRYDQNGVKHTLNTNGTSIETRNAGQRGENGQPRGESNLYRNEHGLPVRQEFFRANGQPGFREMHYRMNADGTPARGADGRPILTRIDVPTPAPMSLVRVTDGPPARWRVETANGQPARGAAEPWEANPQVDNAGNISFIWNDGKVCVRPVDAREDRNYYGPPPSTRPNSRPETTPGANPIPGADPPQPQRSADEGQGSRPRFMARSPYHRRPVPQQQQQRPR